MVCRSIHFQVSEKLCRRQWYPLLGRTSTLGRTALTSNYLIFRSFAGDSIGIGSPCEGIMVGYTPDGKQLSHTEHILAGAASGVVTRMLTQPLDVLKIRFQLQAEPISRHTQQSKYRGTVQAFQIILKEEGAAAFWKGHAGAQWMTAVYMAVEFGAFEVLTKHMTIRSDDRSKKVIHFISGAGAGAVATVVSYPLDIIRTRFIAQGNKKIYGSFITAVQHIHGSSGITGFYRGMGAALVQATPQGALHFGCYETYKQAVRPVLRTIGRDQDSLNAVCGAAAGVTSKLLVYPFDTGKRRLQVKGFEQARAEFGRTPFYNGLIHYLTVAFKEEGIRGLYKGSSWALIKAGVSTSMYFWFYEEFCRLMKQYRYSDEEDEDL